MMHNLPINMGHSRLFTLHMFLAAFPLTLFTSALITDYAYIHTYQMQWANFSTWLIAGGLFVGGFALLVGLIQFIRNRHNQTFSGFIAHFLIAGIAWVLEFINAFIHSRDGYVSIMPTGITLSVISVLLIMFSSWILFSKHQ